jgi:hypothetical protein
MSKRKKIEGRRTRRLCGNWEWISERKGGIKEEGYQGGIEEGRGVRKEGVSSKGYLCILEVSIKCDTQQIKKKVEYLEFEWFRWWRIDVHFKGRQGSINVLSENNYVEESDCVLLQWGRHNGI